MIFDSDYLQTGGVQSFPPAGISPAPHLGILITDTIDCSSQQHLELRMRSYYRLYESELRVAFSTDAGVSFPDTLKLNSRNIQNEISAVNNEIFLDVSDYIGGQDSVRVAFIFDGTHCQGNNCGYYFWMLDDIELRPLPEHSLMFTKLSRNGQAIGDKRININPGAAGFHPTYGSIPLEQTLPMEFFANAYNYGSVDQYKVRLEIEIMKGGSAVQVLSSPPIDTVSSGDTLIMPELITTSTWTPTDTGVYTILWRMVSDSIGTSPNAVVAPVNEELTFTVTEANFKNYEYRLDWNHIDTYFGTADGIDAVGVAYTFPDSHPDTLGFVLLSSLSTWIHEDSDTSAVLSLSIYDTAGFNYGPQSAGPQNLLFRRTYDLNSQNTGTYHAFDLMQQDSASGLWCPLFLPSGTAYYFVLEFSPKAAGGSVSIANNNTLEHTGHLTPVQGNDPDKSVILKSTQGGWYRGSHFQAVVQNPIMRLIMTSTFGHQSPCTVGLKEVTEQLNFQLFPNPSTGKLQIALSEGGETVLELRDATGRSLYRESARVNAGEQLIRDFSNLPEGIYLLNGKCGNRSGSERLILH